MVTVSTIRDNYSLGAGGGINNNGSLTVRDSHLFGNSADNCGGIDSVGIGVTATVGQSSVHGNIARVADGGGSGSGVCKASGTVTLDRSWVRKNNPDNCTPPGSVPGCFG